MTALAASKLITAKKGGTIDMAPGVELVIRPNALEEDTVISADMWIESGRIVYSFSPGGTVFSKSAKLIISREVLEDTDVDDLILYGEDGEAIEPRKNKKKYLVYDIDHFSAYYHRRR